MNEISGIHGQWCKKIVHDLGIGGGGANVQYACIAGDQYIGQYIVACQGGGSPVKPVAMAPTRHWPGTL